MRQLSNEVVWYIIRDNCIQSFQHFTLFVKKTGSRDNSVKNSKLDPNNHYS